MSLRTQHTHHTTPCKRRYLSLWVRLPDLHRVRPHYVDSTASRPICEVKLRQAGLVVWFVRTCEVLVLYFILQIFCEFLLQGGTLLGSTPRLAPSPQRHHSTFLSPFTKENRVISVRRTELFLLSSASRGPLSSGAAPASLV